ncbi:pre-piRNA 3'-exonuclease trimmer-like [Panonychus citri]|uniref:pre-piRNA 3'-exonuclease trimmer-like n=1 Tax=Panonychus citri TaxID=50023 RepID=UPI002307EFAD|nr:pre-piRNA 3'-exonuclease trimmer-like [Panonychus citri]
MQVDITNFQQIYPKVVEQIKNCTFIALDIEFSGLFFNSNCMPSLFDSLEDRYKKLRTNVSNFIPIQLGISTFTKHETRNDYIAQTFSFFCCPRPYGPQVNCFSMEVGAIEFLSENCFDFNRFAKVGIPFLNETQEKIFKSYMNDRTRIDISHSVMDKLVELRGFISDWVATLPVKGGRKYGQSSFPYQQFVNPLSNFLIIDHLRNDFKAFWILLREDNVYVYSVSPIERKQLLNNVKAEEEEVINSCVGLSRLVKVLIDSNKPIIGNNMMVDMVMLYQHYIDTLPGDLQTFKDQLLKNFNSIYDIKAIISNIRKHFPAYEDDISARNLGELYRKLSAPSFIRESPYQPLILRDDDLKCDVVNRCHDAGSDAYATGYVFLRICAMIATAKAENKIKEISPQWESFISPLACFKNKINLIRAAFHYMDLEVKSQVAARPEWLVLRCRDSSQSITLPQIYGMFASYSTTIDFRPISKNEILLAIGNFKSAREIIEKFRKDKNYKITQYNLIKDSKYGRLVLWSTLIVGAGVAGYCTLKLFNQRS